jgi:hypothetical protein
VKSGWRAATPTDSSAEPRQHWAVRQSACVERIARERAELLAVISELREDRASETVNV